MRVGETIFVELRMSVLSAMESPFTVVTDSWRTFYVPVSFHVEAAIAEILPVWLSQCAPDLHIGFGKDTGLKAR